MARKAASGRLTTFFSYKGGVGRTMAVANVGFIAALAGKRVLLMDWDLEAPGLSVYFRGITEPAAAGEIRKAKGVLDLFVDWRDKMEAATTSQAVMDTVRRYRSGKPFEECVCSLMPAARLPKGGRLDIIGAGSNLIGDGNPLPYAEALSRFQWPGFFTDFAGGVLLEALRKWARQNYDYILLDSRTGLADVAGICTMQLPDEVVLCFVLNRQNTEGVADIAAAVRASRGEDVSIRVSPMRVSKDRPTEEADARARAQRALRRSGLDADKVESDMTLLSVAAAPNVPFYETIAPFAATSPTADQLTFDYLRLAQELCGLTFDFPRIDPAWVDEVRQRLQPRMTTIEYLTSLRGADPDRAVDELDRFIDGAIDADPGRELDPDYVQALVSTALEASEWFWEEEEGVERTHALGKKALNLLRHLHKFDEADWRIPLADAIEEFDQRVRDNDGTSGIDRSKELDDLLGDGPQSADIILRRAGLRIQNARLLFHTPRAGPAIARNLLQAEDLLENAPLPYQHETSEEIDLLFAEIANIRAVRAARRKPAEAEEEWRRVTSLLPAKSVGRAAVLRSQAHLSIANMIAKRDPDGAADQIMEAVNVWPASVWRQLDSLERAIEIISAASDSDRLAVPFTIAALGKFSELRVMIGSGPRAMAQAEKFARSFDQLAGMIVNGGGRRREALNACAHAGELLLLRAQRMYRARGGTETSGREIHKALTAYHALFETLVTAGASLPALDGLKQQIDKLRMLLRRTEK